MSAMTVPPMTLDRDRGRGRRRGHPTAWCFEHLTRQADKLGRRRLLWTPSHGDLDRGPLISDPAFTRLVAENRALPAVLLNNTADEGENDIADVYVNNQAVRATLWGRLWNDTPVETDTLALLTGEPSTNGYGAIGWTRDTDWGEPAGGASAGAQKTYSASGGSWGPVTYFTMDTTAAGTGTAGLLIFFVALSASRTLQDGDSLNATPTFTMT